MFGVVEDERRKQNFCANKRNFRRTYDRRRMNTKTQGKHKKFGFAGLSRTQIGFFSKIIIDEDALKN